MLPRSRKFSQPLTRLVFAVGAVAVAGLWFAILLRDSQDAETVDQAAGEGEIRESTIQASFVGTARCAECHADKASDHATSGHSRTFHKVKDLSIPTQLHGQNYVDPIRHTTLEYQKDGAGLSVRIPEVFGKDLFPLQYALGSGQHAFTFLTLVPGPGGDAVGIEHRISLFSDAGADRTKVPGGALGLTPGQNTKSINEEVDHFGHIVSGKALMDCVRCHTTTAEIRGGEVLNLIPNVGCESCHGPGSEHVRTMTGEGPILRTMKSQNVRRLGKMFSEQWSAMDEIRLCGTCHRMPDDVPNDRISPYHASTVRFQPVGLLQSRCFLESEKGMSCSVCHDPHLPSSATKQSAYEDRCLSCHSVDQNRQGTNCPVSPTKNCIGCHMPAIEIHPGVLFHDHWIRIRDEEHNTPAPTASVPANAEAHVSPIN
jgi:hypothetical protein